MRRRAGILLVLGSAAAAALAAIVLATRFAADGTGPRSALGRELYLAHCASCHGENLEGQPNWQTPKLDGRLPAPPHDASGHTWHHPDDVLFRITKHGMSAVVAGHQSDMPGYAGVLSDTEIVAVLDYIKSTWPERERRYQEMRSRAGS